MTRTELAQETLNSIGDAVLSTGLDGNVTYLNHPAEQMTGWTNQAAAGHPLAEVFRIVNRDTRQTVPDPMALAVHLNKAVGLTPNCILIARDGHETAIEDSAAPIHDRDGTTVGAVIVFRDVGAALATSRYMAHLAQHDTLTGLPNRMLLNDRLTEAIALAHRRRKMLAVLFLDLDGFKEVNDSFGHAAGDLLLKSIAGRLIGSLRESDTVSRYSGDEFVVVLTEIDHAVAAAIVAKKLLRSASGPHRLDSSEITVTASIGVAIYPEHGSDADTLITNADTAMYGAKRDGIGLDRMFDNELSLEWTRTTRQREFTASR